ncbi:MAG: hypothetical protein H7Y42_01685 [Chitinophagaceae bacterium]|nr:hypothetical protein [Chitinophagaceae bacterium]
MRLFTSFCFLLFSFLVNGQRFGGSPPSVKWNQVNTDTARIIFPAGMDTQAQRVASIVHYMAKQKPVSLGDRLSKINIVLQNQTVIPNGYVSLGPFRSEFFLNPALNNFDQGTIPWNDQLAIHEYRHVQQFNNFRTGISRIMGTLFGQEGYALAVNAAIPDWFYEGDAVYNETALSQQGRGRLPLFLNAFPSLWQAGKKYSWMKLRNGSLKDYVPDHYSLGYLLVNYGYEKYGADFWAKVTKDAASYKGLFYPFQHAINKHAGVNYKTFYTDAFDFYKKQRVDSSSTSNGIGKTLTPLDEQRVTNYRFPYSISADSLIYLKTSYNTRSGFYIRSGGEERLLRVRDISTDEQFSYRNGKLVYAAYETDPRWSWRDYSVIKVLDIATNKQRTIGKKEKYFTPDISPSGERIAAIHISTTGKSELRILNAQSGEVTMAIKSSDIQLFTDPKFVDDNSLVTVVRLLDGKSALALADIATGALERLTVPSFNVMGYPSIDGGKVYFTASYGGNDDVYALRLSDRKIGKITNGPLGNYFVNAGNGKITWSAFTAEGYQLQQVDEKDMAWTPIKESSVETTMPSFKVSQPDAVLDILAITPDRQFPVSKYSKATGLINFHSWRPYYEDPEFSFSLYGQNILNTTETELYYLYNQNENTHAAGFNFTYGGWFPYLSIGSQYTFNYRRLIGSRLKEWDQVDTRVGLSIPLNWISGKMFNQLNMASSYVFRNDINKGVNEDLFRTINFSYLAHSIFWSQQVQRAVQHIYPRLGYNVSLNYRHAITKLTSWQPLVTGNIYLPGALRSHSIQLSGAYQETDTLNVLFANRFPYSRGYNEAYFARMWKLSANYHFPIIYPDFGVANIVFLQRVRGNVFYDFTKTYTITKQPYVDQRSVGAELFLDTRWWNQHPLTFGFRVSRLLDDDAVTLARGTVFEFILPVSIIPR